ncbi:MAG: hypothetical protein R3C03_00095 [Pirellulaceae bacterium]
MDRPERLDGPGVIEHAIVGNVDITTGDIDCSAVVDLSQIEKRQSSRGQIDGACVVDGSRRVTDAIQVKVLPCDAARGTVCERSEIIEVNVLCCGIDQTVVRVDGVSSVEDKRCRIVVSNGSIVDQRIGSDEIVSGSSDPSVTLLR